MYEDSKTGPGEYYTKKMKNKHRQSASVDIISGEVVSESEKNPWMNVPRAGTWRVFLKYCIRRAVDWTLGPRAGRPKKIDHTRVSPGQNDDCK